MQALLEMDAKNPYLVAILIQCIYAGMYLLSKAAFNAPLQAAATLFIAPVVIISERKRPPPLNFMVLLKIFLLTLVGITFSFNLYSVAVDYTSASVASATSNSVPVITFFLALLLGMETINLKSLSSLAKIFGITLCLAGVVTIAFYQGPSLTSPNHHQLGHGNGSARHPRTHSTGTWIKGCFLLIISHASWSLWLVLQGKVLKEYPSKIIFTALQCLFSAIQSFFVTLGFERHISEWKLGLDVGLLAVAYCVSKQREKKPPYSGSSSSQHPMHEICNYPGVFSSLLLLRGIVVTGVSFYLQTWCIEKKGPVFLAVFSPLAFVITVFFSFFVLGEHVSLGSVLGGLLMVGGLYSVLWGKRREQELKSTDDKLTGSNCQGMPGGDRDGITLPPRYYTASGAWRLTLDGWLRSAAGTQLRGPSDCPRPTPSDYRRSPVANARRPVLSGCRHSMFDGIRQPMPGPRRLASGVPRPSPDVLRPTPGIRRPLLGSMVCVAGALLAAFYQGPPVWFMVGHHQVGHIELPHPTTSGMSKVEWVKGCLIMLAANTAWSLWLTLQGAIVREYPMKMWLAALQCTFSALQSLVLALCLERRPSAWRLGWGARLLSVLYCGKVTEEYPSKIIFTALQSLFSIIQSFFMALGFERYIFGWKLGLDIGLLAIAYCTSKEKGISIAVLVRSISRVCHLFEIGAYIYLYASLHAVN
ncbi:hypothetical protein Taro_022387 [Colocasia esculenta]|uniref:EamA domain-containing protein n=1 Tax=Colocasia esculenta TaxID=4460 RepID=A0A843VB63_COLES|nr:hypothetical protein [Colocasia esculenta]